MRATVLFVVLLLAANRSVARESPLDQSRQCVVVTVPNWRSYEGELRAFERSEGETEWRGHGAKMPVVLGWKGLAWGRGFVKTWRMLGSKKKEGDNKTPAGLFYFGTAFGYASRDETQWIKLPYIHVNHATEGVDDPQSKYYNRIVERTKIDDPDWKSSEKLMRDDHGYRWGVFIEHNSDPVVPGAGSCIYLHVWRNSTHPTLGCIAMAQDKLVSLLEWLDPEAKPFLITVPEKVYHWFPQRWNLPALEPAPPATKATSDRAR